MEQTQQTVWTLQRVANGFTAKRTYTKEGVEHVESYVFLSEKEYMSFMAHQISFIGSLQSATITIDSTYTIEPEAEIQ